MLYDVLSSKALLKNHACCNCDDIITLSVVEYICYNTVVKAQFLGIQLYRAAELWRDNNKYCLQIQYVKLKEFVTLNLLHLSSE